MNKCLHACLVCALVTAAASGQSVPALDSDADGLSDALEDNLLQKFRPTLMVSSGDCATLPASFAPGVSVPTVLSERGTLYGQATLRRRVRFEAQQIELHFYHLWRTDCGRMGHPLDAEHVAVLLEAATDAPQDRADAWTATYWYAAAHEYTICDASQVTRASTLDAVTHGATVWISTGKHASFLHEELCRHGCGGDACVNSTAVPASAVVNLGEAAHPMNGAVWVSSPQWPLLDKITRSDFTRSRLARVDKLPPTDIAWANPAKRPAQAAILGASSTADGTKRAGVTTSDALVTGGHSADVALRVANDKTSNALGEASRATVHALQRSLHSVTRVLHR